jgi:hypothetical protein
MPYTIHHNLAELRPRPNSCPYETFRFHHLDDYCDDMDDAIYTGMKLNGRDYSQDDIDEERQQLINAIPKTEQDFVGKMFFPDTPDEQLKIIRIIMMKMEQEVKDYYEQYGFDPDLSVFGDIGKLYSMWIYVITDEVNFEIEYESDDDE